MALSVDHINYLLHENNEPSEPESGTVLNNFKLMVAFRFRYLCVQIDLLLDRWFDLDVGGFSAAVMESAAVMKICSHWLQKWKIDSAAAAAEIKNGFCSHWSKSTQFGIFTVSSVSQLMCCEKFIALT